MLQVLGEFWMDYGNVIVLTCAAVTLIGAVFTLFHNNSISSGTVDKVESKGNQLSGEHGKLSTEHDKLAAEHSIQSGEHARILDKLVDAKSEIREVKKTVSDVNIRLIQTEADNKLRFINLDDAQKKLCSSAEDIGKFSAEFTRLAEENKLLTKQNEALSRENAELAEQNADLVNDKMHLVAYIQDEKMQHEETNEDWEQEP